MKRTVTVVPLPQRAYRLARDLAAQQEVTVIEAIENALVKALDDVAERGELDAEWLKNLAGER